MRHLAMSHRQLVDFLVILFSIPATLFFAYTLRLSPELTVSIFYLVPIIYLTVRARPHLPLLLLAALTIGILYGMSWNIVLEVHNAYTVVYHSPLLNLRIIGLTPVGDFWWTLLASVYTFLVYEHFAAPQLPQFSDKTKTLVRGGVTIFFLTWLMLVAFPNFPQIPYAFLVLGFVLFVPLYALRYRSREFLKQVFWVTLFFLFANAAIDIALLSLHVGGFYGEYIGWVPLHLAEVPVEEFVFWYVLSTPAMLVVYEWAFSSQEKQHGPDLNRAGPSES